MELVIYEPDDIGYDEIELFSMVPICCSNCGYQYCMLKPTRIDIENIECAECSSLLLRADIASLH